MDDRVLAAVVGAILFVLGWNMSGVWREIVREVQRQARAKKIAEEDARLGVRERPPRQAMYHLAFHGTSGLWAVGDTEREARKLALARWTRLGEGLPLELRVDDPTPEEWAKNLTLVYVEIDSEQAMRELLLPSFTDGDMAPTPWNPEPDHGWEEA